MAISMFISTTAERMRYVKTTAVDVMGVDDCFMHSMCPSPVLTVVCSSSNEPTTIETTAPHLPSRGDEGAIRR